MENTEMNTAWKKAVNHEKGPALVLAGPGSGKTTVILERVNTLIEKGVKPENILVVTFTRKAAVELQDRFAQKYAVNFGTFHSVFFNIQKSADINTNILKSDEIEFDEMITGCYKLLNEDRQLRNKYRNKYEYILIDEFQDINMEQYMVIKILAYPLNNIFAVGDDDQSIYAFRGAAPMIMKKFENDYSPQIILLDVNYRSTKEIVKAAGNLISYNKYRYEKKLKVYKDERGEVDVREFKTRDEQIKYAVKNLKINDAIIVRTNMEVQFIKKYLEDEKKNISVLTMHSAKGLEFDEVYILNVNKGIIPHCRNRKATEIEEERRLFYVAMTRAKQKLHIYYAREHMGNQYVPSDFIVELHKKRRKTLCKLKGKTKMKNIETKNAIW